MGDMYDEETMSHLVYIESLEAAERAQLEARLSLSTNEAASLGALLRFSVGYRLGHLNKPKSWSALSFLHQPIEDMGMRPSRASAVAHRWLARPFSIAFFKIGRATPPFSLVPYDNHAKAVYWLKKDQENAKKAFKEIVEVRPMKGWTNLTGGEDHRRGRRSRHPHGPVPRCRPLASGSRRGPRQDPEGP